ncbi:lytic murein transglycosylase [Ectothiorhodospiraceae bacterium WFHF3C12]|nr:lytic murein transglycosylase [Ectothiorhodospiraceae bacterium WFHF3C12]
MRAAFPLALLLFLIPATAPAAEGFAGCVADLRQRALDDGIAASVVDRALGGVRYSDRVIELDRRQPEFTESFGEYLSRRVNEQRVKQGKAALIENRSLLNRIAGQYGVPAHYLVAFWGLETNFGNYTGNMPTLDSLATLACDPRRSEYFTRELMAALRLLDRRALDVEQLRGSWAGALGNFQFMPSVFLDHAVDRDGDGRADLWDSLPDAAASAANYLRALGWRTDQRWGREVLLPEGFAYHLAGLDRRKPLREWRQLGVRRADGGPLPLADMQASLLVPAGHRGPAFLVYENFRVIMTWNRSQYYALAVGHMADRLAARGPLVQPPPMDEPRLDRATVEAMQRRLKAKGYDPGEPDGLFGPATRGAVRAFERDRGRIADGQPDPELLRDLGLDAPAS